MKLTNNTVKNVENKQIFYYSSPDLRLLSILEDKIDQGYWTEISPGCEWRLHTM
jgi:hypothetical protein